MLNYKNNQIFATFSSLILRLKKEDTAFLISPCQPSKSLSSRKNESCNQPTDVQPKSTLRLYWKTLEMERVETFQPKKIRWWRGLHVCVPKMIWPTWKGNWGIWILLIIAQEKHRTLNRTSANTQLLQFLLSLFKDTPMSCKDTVLTEPLLENHFVNCLIFETDTR